MDAYVEEVFDLETVRVSTKILCKIVDAKYEKSYSNKFTNIQWQHIP